MTLSDIHNVVNRLVYQSPSLELEFSPTFELSKGAFSHVQDELAKMSSFMLPKIPYENTEQWIIYNYMGVKVTIKQMPQSYKNSEIVDIIE